jgi:transcriptional regulator with XRE-family HTH domain
MATFPETLKRLREGAGLTQATLAYQAGLSINTVRDYEQGIKEPVMRSLFRLTGALGVSCEAFRSCVETDATTATVRPKKGRKPKKRK